MRIDISMQEIGTYDFCDYIYIMLLENLES